jgi:hypothetical protein
VTSLAHLADVFGILNSLNLSLQITGKTILVAREGSFLEEKHEIKKLWKIVLPCVKSL